VEGLIHVSEMSWSQHLRNPQDFIKQNDEVEAVVLTLDRDERKMSLGIKQLTEDPWTKEDVLTKYGIGTRHSGVVRNLTNFGLFIELEEGVDGLVHVSDLSWTKKIKHPSEFIKVGESLDVVVLELDVNSRRLALGHKQLEENPWDTFQSVFTVGSTHKATVLEKTDRGAVLELPYGIEGFAFPKNLQKEDGSTVEVGEQLDFKVMEFSKDDRKIILSHTNTYTDTKEDDRRAKFEKKKPAGEKKDGKAGDKPTAAGAERSTLGDLDALSALKEKMMGSEKQAGERKLQAAAEAKSKPAEAETETEAPKASDEPEASKAPAASAAPEATEEPEASTEAEATEEAEVAETPKASASAEATEGPDASAEGEEATDKDKA
jgi:small subunit ribosomal protein S1